MEDNWNGRRLGVQPQFEITGVLCGPTVLPSDVTVVADRVTLKWLFTYMVGWGAVMSPPVLSCHPHCIGVSQYSFDFVLLLLECYFEGQSINDNDHIKQNMQYICVF